MKLSSGKNTNLILLILLIVALLFAVYYYVVLPKKDDLESLQFSVNTIQTEVTTLQEQSDALGQDEDTSTSMFALRKKLPQTREIDQLLLNLEEIEYVTKSRILSINFNSYDELVSESNIVSKSEEEQTDEAVEDLPEVEEENTEEEGAPEKTPISSIAAESFPPELKLITLSIELELPDASNLESFIKEIEGLERIMHIDSINYSLPGEENDFVEDPQNSIFATIQVTTFYYEGDE